MILWRVHNRSFLFFSRCVRLRVILFLFRRSTSLSLNHRFICPADLTGRNIPGVKLWHFNESWHNGGACETEANDISSFKGRRLIIYILMVSNVIFNLILKSRFPFLKYDYSCWERLTMGSLTIFKIMFYNEVKQRRTKLNKVRWILFFFFLIIYRLIRKTVNSRNDYNSSSIAIISYELDITCKARRQFPRESILVCSLFCQLLSHLFVLLRLPLNFELS